MVISVKEVFTDSEKDNMGLSTWIDTIENKNIGGNVVDDD